MEKIRVAIVGYGNIGKYAIEAVNASKDMELSGVVRRSIGDDQNPYGVKITTDISELGKIDVAILAVPTRMVRETAEKYLNLGINTVDSYDIHSSIPDLRKELDSVCKKNNAVSIIAAGWDPGSDSVVRALLEACSPCGITHTNFGPGMSMGHTVAVKAMDGVKDALSVTIPLGTGIHRRMVYVELEDTGYSTEDAQVQISQFQQQDQQLLNQSLWSHDQYATMDHYPNALAELEYLFENIKIISPECLPDDQVTQTDAKSPHETS